MQWQRNEGLQSQPDEIRTEVAFKYQHLVWFLFLVANCRETEYIYIKLLILILR